ncbi:hypothetical protein G7K_4908-t1 [Saitoella complicata NRRL Y-17804]|uniref:Uncharacterized protein n=1 Tax=Saitoella complicata (strain BCRC 22490 / CBS 7301 / JCM 7358 / NBRC 10748 / NRRL Y-17804) TaxID=698492 RepID=A0A0E9NLM9_SAICN|nr:hypothetical protein G7K_4908-t1 [Saitoella complicata NRRL Y-17804]
MWSKAVVRLHLRYVCPQADSGNEPVGLHLVHVDVKDNDHLIVLFLFFFTGKLRRFPRRKFFFPGFSTSMQGGPSRFHQASHSANDLLPSPFTPRNRAIASNDTANPEFRHGLLQTSFSKVKEERCGPQECWFPSATRSDDLLRKSAARQERHLEKKSLEKHGIKDLVAKKPNDKFRKVSIIILCVDTFLINNAPLVDGRCRRRSSRSIVSAGSGFREQNLAYHILHLKQWKETRRYKSRLKKKAEKRKVLDDEIGQQSRSEEHEGCERTKVEQDSCGRRSSHSVSLEIVVEDPEGFAIRNVLFYYLYVKECIDPFCVSSRRFVFLG